jgi:hypothetical protein
MAKQERALTRSRGRGRWGRAARAVKAGGRAEARRAHGAALLVGLLAAEEVAGGEGGERAAAVARE